MPSKVEAESTENTFGKDTHWNPAIRFHYSYEAHLRQGNQLCVVKDRHLGLSYGVASTASSTPTTAAAVPSFSAAPMPGRASRRPWSVSSRADRTSTT
ncbi:uncharacterized protein [Dermacentor albipictus]